MPSINASNGYVFEPPQVLIDNGQFMAVVRNQNGACTRWIRKSPLTGEWLIEWEFGDLAMPMEEVGPYGDWCAEPTFHGWELVQDPNAGKKGDVYICVDPSQREYKFAKSPHLAMSNGDRFMVDPAFGGTKPSPGWRIYRRKKLTGQIKLLPSKSFSKPLPLP